MSSRVNCFQIVGQEVVQGIPLVTDKVSFQKELPFGGERRFLGKERVFYGRPRFLYPETSSYIMLCDSGLADRKYLVVYVEVPALNFGGQPFLDGLNLWPGGEWHTVRPLWQEGPHAVDRRKLRQTLDRAEIWVLEENKQVLLIDQSGGVRALRRQYGQLQLFEVDRFEMADYLCQRGDSMTTHAGALWAYKNLERLQEGFPDVDFGRQLNITRRRLSELEVKVR